MRIPDGAVDYFHMNFPTSGKITTQLNHLSFDDLCRENYEQQVFISGIKK